MNLCVALILANVVFLVGIDRTEIDVSEKIDFYRYIHGCLFRFKGDSLNLENLHSRASPFYHYIGSKLEDFARNVF